MSAQQLLLDRVEFLTVKVETAESASFDRDSTFPQIGFDSSDVKFLTRSTLNYPPDEREDPRHFALRYGLKVSLEQDGIKLPYSIEVEAIGFFRYVGGEDFVGAERFRAVRLSGYQILYGAIREMVSNITARGRHGMWQLPARNFSHVSMLRAEEDEANRQALLLNKNQSITSADENAATKPKRAKPTRAIKKPAANGVATNRRSKE